jgi:predicted nucleotide-binding protein (sugar kinase/HSP70/actin superfamily)
VITTGDMLKKAAEPGFRPERSAFFMPTTMGPCRFGQYYKFHRMVLDELGHRDVKILTLRQTEGFHSDVGALGAAFLRRAWSAVLATDVLGKLLREVRPYEKEKGATDRVYARALSRLERAVESGDDLADALLECRGEFAGVPADFSQPRPRIGLIGEIYVRCHPFANEETVRRVEALGGEAVLPPFEEWLNYISWERRGESLRLRRWGSFFKELNASQGHRRDRGRIMDLFRGHVRGGLHELPTKEILSRASPYIHDSLRGEAVLSVGRAVEYAEDDFAGVVNIAPFGCMPSTIVASLTRRFRRDHRGIPWLDMYFDGTAQTGTQTRLEAFMAQARDFAPGARGSHGGSERRAAETKV